MPGRRTDVGSPRPDSDGSRPSFRTIRVVAVDVDGGEMLGDPGVEPGDVLWVEASRHGQIVGRMEAQVTEGRGAAAVVEEVARTFASEPYGQPGSFPDASLPSVSVVVSTLGNRPVPMARTISSLEALDYPRYEVVVVDNRPVPTPPLTFPGCPHV